MKGEPVITVSDVVDPRVATVIGDGLRRYSAQQSGIDDSRPLAVVVTDPETRQVLGGITGRTSLGVLFIARAAAGACSARSRASRRA